MDANDIVPDVLDAAPAGNLDVIYPQNIAVKLGNELTPTQVKDEPRVSWQSENKTLHTLLMVDPDAPSRQEPKFREILHWAVINIPHNDISAGKTLAEYVGSGPPQGTGLHRYIFLIFQQQGKIETDLYINKITRAGRLNFNTRDFIAKHKLSAPVAGNYYQAQYDDYVPRRNQQFTG